MSQTRSRVVRYCRVPYTHPFRIFGFHVYRVRNWLATEYRRRHYMSDDVQSRD